MSSTNTYEIGCPKCGHEQSVVLHEAVNVEKDPELRDALMANQLNQVSCDACEAKFRVDKPLLYQDLARKVMIYLLPVMGGDADVAQSEFSDWMANLQSSVPADVKLPTVHLVMDRVELVERIFLLEEGLDERIIEYIKYIIYSKNLKRVNPEAKALLLDVQDSTEEKLCFVIQDVASRELDGVLEYSREAYKGFCEMFDRDEQTPSLLELFPGPHISARQVLLKEQAAGQS